MCAPCTKQNRQRETRTWDKKEVPPAGTESRRKKGGPKTPKPPADTVAASTSAQRSAADGAGAQTPARPRTAKVAAQVPQAALSETEAEQSEYESEGEWDTASINRVCSFIQDINPEPRHIRMIRATGGTLPRDSPPRDIVEPGDADAPKMQTNITTVPTQVARVVESTTGETTPSDSPLITSLWAWRMTPGAFNLEVDWENGHSGDAPGATAAIAPCHPSLE